MDFFTSIVKSKSMATSTTTTKQPKKKALPIPQEHTERDERAAALIRRYALYCTGSTFLPSMVLDVAAQTAIQTKMIIELGKLYGFETDEQIVRTAVTSGITSLGGRMLSGALAGLAKQFTPLKSLFGGLLEAAFSGFLTAEVGLYYQQQLIAGHNPGDVTVVDIIDHITDQIQAGKFNPTASAGLRNQFAYLFPSSETNK